MIFANYNCTLFSFHPTFSWFWNLVPVPKAYQGCSLQEGRDATNSYNSNSGWIPVRRKYRNHRSPKFKIADNIDDPMRANFSSNHGQAEKVLAPSSIMPPPSRIFTGHVKEPYPTKTPAKNKNKKPVLSTSRISNGHLDVDVLLKEYATVQDELKLYHHSIDSSSKSITHSLRQSLKLISTQKCLNQELFEFEIDCISPYWCSQADTIYQKLLSQYSKALQFDFCWLSSWSKYSG